MVGGGREGGVASWLEMEGLQGRILNYTHTKGRSHGGHFLRPPAPQVACGVSCRWCPCYMPFAGHAFQLLIRKQPKSLAALSLCSYLIATQILWNSFWIPSPGEVVVQSYLFIYWIRKGDTFNISHIDLNEWSVADSRIKAKNLKIC